MKNRKGFTFIETLIVIGIITLLATTVVVMVNPAKRFEAARNKQREIHLQAILSAIEQKMTIEGGWFDGEKCDPLPQEVEEEGEGEEGEEEEEDEELTPIFKTIGTGEEKPNPDDYYDLFSCLVPKYMVNPLYDPVEGSEEDTHYQIWQNPQTKYVTLRYVSEKLGEPPIVVGAKKYVILRVPTVVTEEEIENITYTSARVWGEVTNDGGASVLERGVIWGTGVICETEEGLKILTEGGRIVVGSGEGLFSGTIIGLTHDTEYCVRAYAKNEIGYGYGTKVSFQSLSGAPAVRTLEADPVTFNQATLWGEVTRLGPEIDEISSVYRYFKWAQARKEDYNEETANETEKPSGGLGEFSHILKGLEYNPEIPVYYSFQACAESYLYGERCGGIEEFYTKPGPPLVTTLKPEPADIGPYEALLKGKITHTGGATVIAWGICFAEGGDPSYPGDCLTEPNPEPKEEPFEFEIKIGGEESEEPLKPGTPYRFFAFAENDKGPGFAYNTLEFTTQIGRPTVETLPIDDYGNYWAYLGGKITASGGAPIEYYGVCWAIYPEEPPYSPGNCLTEENGQEYVFPYIFTYKLKNFLAGTTYNVQAFASNEADWWTIGPLEDFTTLSPAQEPELGSIGVDNVKQSTANFQGTIKNHGGAKIIEHGFCWCKWEEYPAENGVIEGGCTEPDLGLADLLISKDEEGADFEFFFTATDLSMKTDYNVQAYAKNEIGYYGYGGPETFETKPPDPPKVETLTEEVIVSGREAWAKGRLISDGGDPETKVGICYSSWPAPAYPSDCTVDTPDEEGVFTGQMTKLKGGYTYHYRAYAWNNVATIYGEEYSFVAGSEQGATCPEEAEDADYYCHTKHCVDRVCCENECPGTCWSCNIEGHEGECTVADEDTDPRDQCSKGMGCSENKCARGGTPGVCDGYGACKDPIDVEYIRYGHVCTGLGEETEGSDTVYASLSVPYGCDGACQKKQHTRACDGLGGTVGPNVGVKLSYLSTAGKVCSGGNEVAPSSAIHCRLAISCVTHACSAPRYYEGCAAGSASCTTIDRESYTAWNVYVSSAINENTYKTGSTCSYSYTQYCLRCKQCNGSGSCSFEPSSNWGEDAYNCTGSNRRCYDGGCRTCYGFLYDDGCSGCAGQGEKACWYKGEKGQSCNTVCGSKGCVARNWNDKSDYKVCKHFFGSDRRWLKQSAKYAPNYHTALLPRCNIRTTATTQDCEAEGGKYTYRLCVCNY